jgi:signal transduction histidine kinase
MERFVRGDASRSSEGSGLGLNIAESLCTIMNGSFEISVDGDLFKTCIILPAAE